jgi:hypothetical protein
MCGRRLEHDAVIRVETDRERTTMLTPQSAQHRCGDGSEHLHWWFMARPARFPQLIGSFAAIWDDVLPPTPDLIWQSNLDHVVEELRDARRAADVH